MNPAGRMSIRRAIGAEVLLFLTVAIAPSAAAAPPSITPIPDQAVLEGWTLTYQVMAADPDGDPLTFSLSGPAWMTISSTGLITMAPPGGTADPGGTVAGATVTVSDGTAVVSDAFDTRLLDARADQAEHGGGNYGWWFQGSHHGAVVGEGLLALTTSDLPIPGHQAQRVTDKGFGFVEFDSGEPDRPIVLGRIYNSSLERDQIQHGRFGGNWLGTYDWSIQVNGSVVDVTTNRGGKIRFQSPAARVWTLIAPADVPHRLGQTGPDFLFFDAATGWVQRFDATTGVFKSSEDTRGYVLTMGYTGSLLTSVSDPFGRTLSFTYDRSGRVIQASDGTRSVSYAYDAAGTLTSFTNAAGGVTQYAYAASPMAGLLIRVTEPAGNIPHTSSYGPNGEVTSIVDAGANTTGFAYTRDPSGRVTMVQVARAVPGGFTFRNDLDGRCFEMTDPAGGITAWSFDAQGRVISRTRPLGDVTSYTYDAASGRISSIGFADATSIGMSYASRFYGGALTLFHLASVSRPDGTTLSYSHDASGNLTSFTEPGSIVWSWTYNAFGRPLTFRNPEGGITSYTYDSMGRLQALTDPLGNATNYTYDALDRLIQVTDPGAPGRAYSYDTLDRMLSTTNELGKTWSYQYDANGRLLRVIDPATLQTQFTWSAMNRLIRIETPLGAQTSYAYDGVGRLRGATDPTARTTNYEYDDIARVLRVRDPAGQATTYTYDANERMIRRADPLSQTTQYAYDAMDRLTTLTDPVSTAFTFTYDVMDRVQTIAGPLGYLRGYDYDARGLLIRSVFGSVAEEYTRTALGAIASVRDPNGNLWGYTYDVAGRLVSSSDPLSRTTSYTYDARWNLSHVTTPVSSLALSYDAARRLTQRSYSDGLVIPYTYDDLGRLLTTQGASFTYDADGRVVSSSGGIGYAHDAAGRLMSMTYAPGKSVQYTYDTRGNLATVVDWVGGTTAFTYDASGRRTRLARPDGSITSYVYDAADRLIRLADIRTDSTASIAMAYDALGRTTSATRRQPLQPTYKNETSTYSYDAAGQITGYTYDGLGRLLSDGARSYEWDAASRLKTGTSAAGSLRLEYDGLGRVTRRTLGTEVEDDVHAHPSSGLYRRYGIFAHNTGPLHGELHLRWTGSLPGPGDGWYRYKPHVAPIKGQGTMIWLTSKPRGSFSGAFGYILKSSSPAVDYVSTPSGELLHSVDDASGARRFYHFDEWGNTIFLSNDAGSVVTSYAYSVSGSSVDELGLGTPHLGRYTYKGQLGAQEESGIGLLFRSRAGIYDGRTSRVIIPTAGPLTIGGVDYTITGHAGDLNTSRTPIPDIPNPEISNPEISNPDISMRLFALDVPPRGGLGNGGDIPGVPEDSPTYLDRPITPPFTKGYGTSAHVVAPIARRASNSRPSAGDPLGASHYFIWRWPCPFCPKE